MVFGSSVKHTRGQKVGLDHVLAVSSLGPDTQCSMLTVVDDDWVLGRGCAHHCQELRRRGACLIPLVLLYVPLFQQSVTHRNVLFACHLPPLSLSSAICACKKIGFDSQPSRNP